jgi:DNA-binding phage protein
MAHRGWKRGGFTPAKKAKAIEAMGKYGNVSDATRVAGISDTTFYRHLKKDPEFARSCDLARERAARPIETLAWQRATEGAPETVIRNGEVVQIRIKPSDSMLGMLLRASDPKKYGRLSRGGATRKQIERKLRRKIEAETRETLRRELVASDEEVTEALFKALTAHGIRVRAKQAEEAGAGEP